jgi:GNAT superfamily N-acetyltransferase
MTEEMNVKIVEYDETMAESLADMYNTWDELWPGGYTQGIPYDAERVRKNFGKMNAIAILIALDKETGLPVGSCTLHEHWRDADAAYIGTLGVSPEALGKKVGKHLLLESVRRVHDRGFARVDLNTWAGNTRAVPLYKKIGLMWNPGGDGLTMEGYVPGILDNALCRPFFDKHATGEDSWYNLHIREIVQAPDDVTDRGMAVYKYRFESDGDSIDVMVDRLARGICGIKREIDNASLSIRSLLTTQDVICGVEQTHTVEIENCTPREVAIEIALSGPEGIKFVDRPKTKITVPEGESVSWEIPFTFGSDSELFRMGIKAPSIVSSVKVDGAEIELVVGARVTPAAEIYQRQGYCRVAPGGSCIIPLTIMSNLNEVAEAKIHLESSKGITASLTEDSVSIPPSGLSGIQLSVSTDSGLEGGSHDLWLWLEIGKGSFRITTRKNRIPIFCLGENKIAIGENDRKKRIVIATPWYIAECYREGGILRAEDPLAIDLMVQTYRTDIGPPFGLSPFRFAERELEIEQHDRETVVTLSADHPDRPLVIEDKSIFEHNSGIIRREVWVRNSSSSDHTCQVRIMGRQVGLTFNQGIGVYPLPKGVVAEPIGAFRMSYPVLSSEPDTLSEGWVATEGAGQAIGNFWNPDELEEVRVGSGLASMLASKMLTLKAKECRRALGVTMIFGASSWHDIRRTWNARINGAFDHGLEPIETPKLSLDVSAKPSILSCIAPSIIKSKLENMIPAPIQGRIHVEPPSNWELLTEIPEEVTISDMERLDLELKPTSKVSDDFGIHTGRIQFISTTDYSSDFDIVSLGSSKAKANVTAEEMEGKKVYRVSNGNLEFIASAEYGGCLFSLRNSNDVEFLISSFPNPGPRPGGFFDNYYGGIQPVIFDEETNVSLEKAKTNQEKMKITKCEDGAWTGVEISWTGSIQKIVRGVDFSLKYLTAPGSPLVLVKWTMKNRTDAPLRFFPTLLTDPAINKDPSKLHIEAEWGGYRRQVRHGPAFNALVPSSMYAILKPSDESLQTNGIGFISPGREFPMLAAHGGAIIFEAEIDVSLYLQPGEEHVMRHVIFVDPKNQDDVRKIQQAARFF